MIANADDTLLTKVQRREHKIYKTTRAGQVSYRPLHFLSLICTIEKQRTTESVTTRQLPWRLLHEDDGVAGLPASSSK